jgi:co-chaperonin GroES (HSP10)
MKTKESLKSLEGELLSDGENRMHRKNPKLKPRTVSMVRAIMPLGMRVVVHIRHDLDRTDSGLYLPEGAKEEKQESLLGEVIEVASAHDEELDEETNISGVPQGALVLIARDSGISVPWDDDIRIVETCDVLAIVEESELN